MKSLVMACAALTVAVAQQASATITYEYAVNAYGIGWVKYTASDNGGTNSGDYYVFSGSTTMSSPNGANSVKIDFFVFYGYQITTLARKSVGLGASGSATGTGLTTFLGNASSDGNGLTYEVSVLNVPISQIESVGGSPRDVSSLISGGWISPSNVMYSQTYGSSIFAGGYTSPPISTQPVDNVIFHGYVTTVPAPGGAVAAIFGVALASRRRR